MIESQPLTGARAERFLLERYEKVRRDLEARKVPIGKVEKIRFNPRLRSTMGRCARKGERFEIEINPTMADASRIQMIDDVIAHELIHTIHNCQNHSTRFRNWMNYVNSVLPGYCVRVYFHYEDYGLENPRKQVGIEDYPYLLECENCHAQIGRMRRSAVVDHPERYRCIHCHGRLIRIR